MAKDKQTKPPASAGVAKESDTAQCERIMRAQRGMGIPGSVRLVKTFSPELVEAICKADDAGERHRVASLIIQHAAKKSSPVEVQEEPPADI